MGFASFDLYTENNTPIPGVVITDMKKNKIIGSTNSEGHLGGSFSNWYGEDRNIKFFKTGYKTIVQTYYIGGGLIHHPHYDVIMQVGLSTDIGDEGVLTAWGQFTKAIEEIIPWIILLVVVIVLIWILLYAKRKGYISKVIP